MKIEDKFKALEEIVKELDNGEVSLEESFDLYKKGMDMLKECNNDIEKVEKQMIILQNEDNDEE